MQNNTNLSHEQLKEYMKILLDLEKNIYIQQKTLTELNNTVPSLAISQKIDVPQKAKTDIVGNIIASCIATIVVISILAAVIIFFIEIHKVDNFMYFIGCIIKSIAYGSIIGIIAGIVLGLIIGIICCVCDNKKIKKEYNFALQEYYFQTEEDSKRVNQEKIQKSFILHEISALKQKNDETQQKLTELYNYNILDQDYRHNIVAIASMYGYLRKGICRCLEYNDKTGDDGAYKIYETERRLNKIITNTDTIIQKLDIVIENQRELQLTMIDATNTINRLVTNTDNISKSIGNIGNQLESLESNSEISIYNQNQTKNELKYMNFMNDIYRKY
ncbi:MAG: hypothetical protein ACI4XP_10500 [Acutalibacteraceae bacterium]